MAGENIYQELKDILQEFKDFLDTNVPVIKPAITALKSLVPQISELLTKLIELMNALKTEITNLDVSGIPGLAEASEFTSKVKAFLEAAKSLLTDQADEINAVLEIADVVTGLPSLDAVKGDILSLLDAIIAHLNNLNS
jgi:hypothetical protein